jgi:hypothetical protein
MQPNLFEESGIIDKPQRRLSVACHPGSLRPSGLPGLTACTAPETSVSNREDCFTNRTTTIKFAFMVMLLLIGQSSCVSSFPPSLESAHQPPTTIQQWTTVDGGASNVQVGPIWAFVTHPSSPSGLRVFDKDGNRLAITGRGTGNLIPALVLKEPLKLFTGCDTLIQPCQCAIHAL